MVCLPDEFMKMGYVYSDLMKMGYIYCAKFRKNNISTIAQKQMPLNSTPTSPSPHISPTAKAFVVKK